MIVVHVSCVRSRFSTSAVTGKIRERDRDPLHRQHGKGQKQDETLGMVQHKRAESIAEPENSQSTQMDDNPIVTKFQMEHAVSASDDAPGWRREPAQRARHYGGVPVAWVLLIRHGA